MEEDYHHIFNSMPIDEYYDFRYGELNYRSIKFHDMNIPSPKLLPTVTVNFTNSGIFTRMTEWKNLPFHGSNNNYTTITFEEPCDYKENNFERYYPVKDLKGENRELYMKYKIIKNAKVDFVGRLGLYSYLDMDQCINLALKKVSENFMRKNK